MTREKYLVQRVGCRAWEKYQTKHHTNIIMHASRQSLNVKHEVKCNLKAHFRYWGSRSKFLGTNLNSFEAYWTLWVERCRGSNLWLSSNRIALFSLDLGPQSPSHAEKYNSLLISSLFSHFIENKYLHGNMGTYKIGELPWHNTLGFFCWGR